VDVPKLKEGGAVQVLDVHKKIAKLCKTRNLQQHLTTQKFSKNPLQKMIETRWLQPSYASAAAPVELGLPLAFTIP